MLLRNRSRAVTKANLMGDQSPNARTIPFPSLFGSPKFKNFITANNCLLSVAEVLQSPTSILDTRAFGNPFSRHNNTKRKSWDKVVDSKKIGLAIVKNDDETFHHNNSDKLSNRKVLFGTDQLRVKIPSLVESKTKDDHSEKSSSVLSLSEMELSEDYTCVISHAPNPRTTHIFENCVVESPCFSVFNTPHSFLDFCYTCKKHLEQTKDIYIYRGEKAFCSQECRHQEMVLDGAEN